MKIRAVTVDSYGKMFHERILAWKECEFDVVPQDRMGKLALQLTSKYILYSIFKKNISIEFYLILFIFLNCSYKRRRRK